MVKLSGVRGTIKVSYLRPLFFFVDTEVEMVRHKQQNHEFPKDYVQ